MAEEQMKKWSTSLALKEMQIKVTLRFHLRRLGAGEGGGVGYEERGSALWWPGQALARFVDRG
jgi:hypothetical protein